MKTQSQTHDLFINRPYRINRGANRAPGMDMFSPEEMEQKRRFCQSVLRREAFKNRDKQLINPKSTICVFSNPRGGSTWLGEILLQLPKSALCNEAIFRLPQFSELGFTWHQPIPAGTHWPEAKELFRKLLNRETMPLRLYHANDLEQIPAAQTHVFKFCHGNLLLEWFADNFDVLPILLVRHPCAVVASQLKHPGWKTLKRKKEHRYTFYKFPFCETYLQYEDVLATVKTKEEVLAATWCLTMVNSLASKANDRKWITVAYENLYANFEFEIHRIFGRLDMEIPPSVYSMDRKASISTKGYSKQFLYTGKQLSSWKETLTTAQQHNVMGIVKAFGLDQYSLEPMPDLDKMYVHMKEF